MDPSGVGTLPVDREARHEGLRENLNMTLKASVILVSFAVAFSHGQGCPPSPPPVPPDASDAAPPPPPAPDAAPPPPADAGPQTDYNLACAALAIAGCKEGQATDCASAMQKAQEGRINDYKPKCLIACKTKACVHACGKAVACP